MVFAIADQLQGKGLRTILLAHRAGVASDLSESLLVAHPERHLGSGAIAVLTALVREGALVQGTAALFADGDDSPLFDLARRGLIHVLGSDSHSARIRRPVRLSPGFAALTRIPEIERHADWIAEMAPAAIIAGEEVVPPFPPA